jgi:hypothetical protein
MDSKSENQVQDVQKRTVFRVSGGIPTAEILKWNHKNLDLLKAHLPVIFDSGNFKPKRKPFYVTLPNGRSNII